MNILTLSAKNCMSHLLLKDTFDHFSFIEGEITTFNTFTIDGFLKKDFFDEAPEDVHSHWKDVREFCFQIIRGKRTPLSFKIILLLRKTLQTSSLNTKSADSVRRIFRECI